MDKKRRKLLLDFTKKIVEKEIYFNFVIVSKFKKKPEEFFLNTICQAIENEEFDISYRLRPNRFDAVPLKDMESSKYKYAIVLQGPLRKEKNFTLNTVKYYRKLYKNAIIIVSTWEDEEEMYISALKNAGAYVVLNEKPIYEGHLNINYQLVSSRNGVSEAEKWGVDYICKTRTDQRICKPYIFEYIMNLMNIFPPIDSKRQRLRLVALSMHYGNMFYPYLISDFFYFGTCQDMVNLFSLDLDLREKFEMGNKATKREYSKMLYAPEVYIMKHYFEYLGHQCNYTVEDYWEAVRKYLICVDKKTLDVFWPKYERKYQENAYLGDFFLDDIDKKYKTMNFDFVNWFNLYMGTLTYNLTYEELADIPFI